MDDDLRALERELAASGALEARLRLAAALTRAGRGDDAVRALLPASADAAVRRELARCPSSGTAHRDGTRWHPGPLPVRPRVRWSQTARTSAGSDELLASPQAILWARGASEQSIVFDPDTGRPQAWLDDVVEASLRGTRALLRGDAHGLRLVDLATHERLDQVEAVADAWRAPFRAIDLDEDGAGYVHAGVGVVEAVRLEAGGRRVVWRREVPISSARTHGDLVLVTETGRVTTTRALARADGATRWEASGWLVAVDPGGVFLWDPLPPGSPRGALELRRRDGARVWRRPAGRDATARSCGPRLVVEGRSEGRRRSLHLLDRGTGEERAVLEDGPWGPGSLLQVGDAVLHWPGRGLLRACDHEGGERWRLQLDAHAVSGSGPVAVTPGRLLVASADHLVCIDEAPGAGP